MQPDALDSPGKRMRFLRVAKGMTQLSLARKAYTSQPAVSHWEADRYLPGRPTQVIVAEALGTSRLWLFGEDLEQVA
jgi:transcriptional regulator with XRE-family HTH domain